MMPDWDEVLVDWYFETYELETDEDDEEIGADWDENAQWGLDDEDEEDTGEADEGGDEE